MSVYRPASSKPKLNEISESCGYLKVLHTLAFFMPCLIPVPKYALSETPFENL